MMFNKIILLLVLLIPSFCFGRSVCISVITDKKRNIQTVGISDSQSGKQKFYELKIQNGEINISENIDVFMELKEELYLLFRTKSFDFANNQKSYIYWRTNPFIIQNAVYANWQITDTTSDNNDIFRTAITYIYKPDK